MKCKNVVVGFAGTSCDAWVVYDFIHNEYYEYTRKCDAVKRFYNILLKHYKITQTQEKTWLKYEIKNKLKNIAYKYGIKLKNVASLENVTIKFPSINECQ